MDDKAINLISAGEELAYIVGDMLEGSVSDIGPSEEDVRKALSDWSLALMRFQQ